MKGTSMTAKQRVHFALEGKPVDRFPVTVCYNQLYCRDHFSELTERPHWEMWKWMHASPEDHLDTYKCILDKVPFDILQPQIAPSLSDRQHVRFIEHNGEMLLHNTLANSFQPLCPASGHAFESTANETQYIFDRSDIKTHIRKITAADILSTGSTDYMRATADALGKDRFILTAGVLGTLYACHQYVGLTNLFSMLVEAPDLIDEMATHILEQNIEHIRAYASAGGDAIYIDDATATCDMISIKHYERFSLPYMTQMVDEIHRLGHKAILIYFGGIADRLDQIVSTGADGLIMEASMKTYVNDISEIAQKIGQRITLFGNIDPIGILQDADDPALDNEISRQLAAAKHTRGFVLCNGSPITPSTPLARVQKYLRSGRALQ